MDISHNGLNPPFIPKNSLKPIATDMDAQQYIDVHPFGHGNATSASYRPGSGLGLKSSNH